MNLLTLWSPTELLTSLSLVCTCFGFPLESDNLSNFLRDPINLLLPPLFLLHCLWILPEVCA